MFNKKIVAAAVATITAMGLGASSAHAVSLVRHGTATAATSPVSAPVGPAGATLTSGSLTANCTGGGFAANIITNPNPGFVPIDVTSLLFNTCTDNIPLINFVSATLITAPERAHVTTTQVAFQSHLTVRVTLNTGATCDYTSIGTPLPTDPPYPTGTITVHTAPQHSVTFTNIPVTRTAGSTLCPNTSPSFSATYGPITDSSGALVDVIP